MTDAIPAAPDTPTRRVPAAERRDALIAAAVHEFAQTGLHGTPVGRIARRVGVAQPYVFSLFAGKRDLFLAAVERGFDRITEVFETAAAAHRAGDSASGCRDALGAMGFAYVELLHSEPDYLLLQHQSYAACADVVVRDRVRRRYAELVSRVAALSDAGPEPIDAFFRTGMALNVAAALGVEDLSVNCGWIRAELESPPAG